MTPRGAHLSARCATRGVACCTTRCVARRVAFGAGVGRQDDRSDLSSAHPLVALLNERIVILDGAMGTALQEFNLQESDYRLGHFERHEESLKGNHDLLSLTRPEIVRSIHRSYLEAGADIVETNTFSSTSIAQADYGLEATVRELNLAATTLAREAVAKFVAATGRLTDGCCE